jgi:hypothetical protein
MTSIRLAGFAAALAFACLPAAAQGIVSARAGLIDYSDGRVLLNERPTVHKAAQFEEVHDGEYLRTEKGRAEVLLTPGIFLRLGEDSQIQMLSSKLSDVRLRLLAGEAVIEADDVAKDTAVSVVVNDATVRLLRHGLYRLAASGEAPQLRVSSGEAEVKAAGAVYRVKSKKEIELAGNYAITKFDPEDTDPLDRWSKRRSSYMSAANVSASALVYNSGYSLTSSQWAYNPYFGMFTYLPYNSVCWSPYGWGFYSPRTVYYYIAPQAYYGGGGGGSGVSALSRSYNSSYGYNTVGQTAGGGSGVLASRGVSAASVGGVSGGAISGGGFSRGGGSVGGGGGSVGGGGGMARGGGGGGGARR